MERVVVVGGGLAGHRALQALRNFEGAVTLVSDEEHRPYDRPPLSKQVLQGDMEPDGTYFSCDDLDVEWVLGRAAEGLDTHEQLLQLAGGEDLPYDGLVIATGRHARTWPDLPDLDGFHTLRSLDDAVRLKEAAADCSRIAIVGAGFIGCEVAASLRKHGVEEITLIDVADQPMPPIGPDAGAFARRIHEEQGVRFKLGAAVQGFEGTDGRVSAVSLEGDEPVEAELVLLALGSAPNSEWLENSGVELLKGNVVCDEHCLVSGAENVVAAGDIAAWPHPHAANDHGRVWIEHWTTSREMAAVAAKNLIVAPEDRARFLTVPTFWSDQYDVKIKSAGLLEAADRFEVVEEDVEKNRLVIEALRVDELVGVIVFNKNKAFIDYQRRLRGTLAAAA